MGAAGTKGRATRARVIEAARKCITELGYHGASSNEIARWAGVSWGVIQYHFGSREAILLAIVDGAVSELQSRLEALEVRGGRRKERLASIADVVWSYYADPHYMTYLEIYINLTRDPSASSEARRRLSELDAEIAELWRRLVGRLFDPPPSEAVERLLFSCLRGLAITRSLLEDDDGLHEERRLLVEALAPWVGRTRGALASSSTREE